LGREPPAPLHGLRPREAKVAIDDGRAIAEHGRRPLEKRNGREGGVIGCVFRHRHTCHNRQVTPSPSQRILLEHEADPESGNSKRTVVSA
jgi:hypothetical protein